ncbi:MAG: xanthine dehydrogenase family protein molybdopterin-binding subunit, partial [Nitrospinota bacterium]|nr:xanthine dehydrogenase family protein molybdopterin-binding subunit [Nitrospinota bacterium]
APRLLPHKRSTPLIARDRVRYMGDVVALVAAETGEAAVEALRRIRVKYEPLPVVDGPRDAMARGASRLWPGGNLLNHAKIRTGNLEAGFRSADVVVEGEYRTPPVDHLYLEVEAACAMPLPGGSYLVWGCTQQPFLVRERVAQILGLRGGRAVRFIQTLPGGSFGGKSEASVDVCLRAAILARATGKPVKLVYSREESMIASAKRHGAIIRSRLGAARGGRLTAAEVEIYLDKGAYAASGGDNPPAFKRATYHALGPYTVPNAKVDVYCVHTNNPYGGQMRGPGCPQVNFAGEQQMDRLAEDLGIDPIELRRINGLRAGVRTPWNQRLGESVGLIETLEKADAASGWSARAARRSEDNRLKGIGVASCLYGTGNAYSAAEARVYLTSEGKLQIAAGVVDFGQGSKTILSQIAAETMNIPYEAFRMETVDTAIDPFGGTSSSSRVTMQGGKAVYLASLRAREEIFRLAGHLLEADPGDLKLRKGVVRPCARPARGATLLEIAKAFVSDELKLLGGSDSLPPTARVDEETGHGEPYEVYGFGTQVAEVLVDPDTGEVEVSGFWAAHDVGKAINPLGVSQQVDGGVYMGLGFCLMEEIVQPGGRMANPDMHGYLIPTAKDVPDRVETIIVEDSYSNGPYGAKGVGEQVNVPTAAAIANAIHNAVGIRIHDMPFSPEKVLAALEAKASNGG